MRERTIPSPGVGATAGANPLGRGPWSAHWLDRSLASRWICLLVLIALGAWLASSRPTLHARQAVWRPLDDAAINRLRVGVLIGKNRELPFVARTFMERLVRRLKDLESSN